MKQDLMALATVVAIIIAFGILFIVKPAELLLNTQNALMSSFIIGLFTMVMAFVIGTLSTLKSKKSKRKQGISDNTKLTMLAGAILLSFALALIATPYRIELSIQNLAMANLIIQAITMVMIYVVGTLIVISSKKKK